VDCCEPQGYDRIFSSRQARLDADRYRRSGLTWDPGRVVELYRAGEIEGETVLDVGAGIGDLGVELLRAGAAAVTSIDLSPAYDAVAAELLAEAGLAARSRRVTGDVAAHPELAPPADVVTALKVVCCYHDAGRLLRAVTERAQRHVVLSYPRDTWWIRVAARAVGLGAWLRRSDWRFVVHPETQIMRALVQAGFTVVRTEDSRVFRLAVATRLSS
jgi:magnesium-protoporphyrin O-methyltransferase